MKKAFLIIILFALALANRAYAATGDISAVRIVGNATTITDTNSACNTGTGCNGWVAEVDISNFTSTSTTFNMGLGTNNDPTNAKIVFTVTSNGYNNQGIPVTYKRTVYGTQILRLPYPRALTLDEATTSGKATVLVALSDFIYGGETATVSMGAGWYTDNGLGGTGGSTNATTSAIVTNNSQMAYPKTIGHFALEQRRPVDGITPVEVFAVQRFASGTDPVAVVNITAVGASSGHIETGTTTAMVLSSRGDKIPVYSVNLNLSTSAGFTRGELININFTAYPWIGTSTATLSSSVDAGSQIYQLGTLEWTVMDKMIAVVDPSTGNDGTCVASLNQSTADASPCLTENGALTVIQAQNNSSYGLDRLDGGEVQLKAGNYITGLVGSHTVTNGYFTLTSHSSTNQAGVVFNGASGNQYQYPYERYYNVTFNRTGNGYLVFAANPYVLVMEKVNFLDSHTAWYSGDTNTDLEVLDSSTTNSYFTLGGNDGHSRLNRNNIYNSIDSNNAVIGQASITLGLKGNGGGYGMWGSNLASSVNNIVIAYTKWYAMTDGEFVNGSSVYPITNMALINNLVERIGSSATPIWEISAFNHSNILNWYNTYAGQRENHENDWGTPSNKFALNWGAKFNIFDARGDHRSDIRAANSSIVGYWDVGYSVGWQGNFNEALSYSGDDDFWGLNSNTPTYPATGFTGNTPVGFVSDKSQSGTNVGNGDYHLTSLALALNLVQSGQAMMPYDIDGTARRNDGTGAAGAYEYAPSGTTYYIDFSAGSDSNNGTSEGTPWKHMPGMSGATGVPAAYSEQSGDTFVLKGGVTWTFVSTTDDLVTVGVSGITIEGGQTLGTPWGSGYPIIDASVSTIDRYGISSNNKSNVTVNGIEIANLINPADYDGKAFAIFGTASSWEIENCLIDNVGVDAVSFSPASGSKFLFHDNIIKNTGRTHALFDDGVVFDDVEFYNNTFYGQGTWSGGGFHGDGLIIGSNSTTNPSTLTNVKIYDNKFLGSWSASALIYLNDGSNPAGKTYNGGYHAFIYNNQMAIDSDGFISPALFYVDSGWRDVQVYNNSFNAVTPTQPIGVCLEFDNMNTDAAVVIKNNIINGCDNGIVAKDLASTTGLTADYNLYYTNANNKYIWDSTNRWGTLADLQAQGYEAHGKVGQDPKYSILPNGTTGYGNWHLQPGSPALGMGLNLTSLGITPLDSDLEGVARSASLAWNVGAYDTLMNGIQTLSSFVGNVLLQGNVLIQ